MHPMGFTSVFRDIIYILRAMPRKGSTSSVATIDRLKRCKAVSDIIHKYAQVYIGVGKMKTDFGDCVVSTEV